MFTTARIPAAIVLLLPACAATAQVASPATDQGDHLDISATERISYDDNVFRLPDGVAVDNLPAEDFSRGDSINRITLGLAGQWFWRRQEFVLDLNAGDNRFARNDALDHVSGNGRLQWNWRTIGKWSGKAGIDYDHSLASFANSRIFTRDLLDTVSYQGEVRYGIGARWALQAGGRQVETTHSASLREFDDFQGTSTTAALEYLTPAGTLVAGTFLHTGGRFTRDLFLDGALLERDYSEDTVGVRLRHPLTGQTVVEGTAGYLRRDYDNGAVADFSGDVWRFALYWQPGFKTQVVVAVARELKAYPDAESDYFESTGASLAPTWSPTEKIKLAAQASWEQQDYVGSNPAFAASHARRDTVAAAQARLTYMPRSYLDVELMYRREQRDSNRAGFEFDDNLSSLALRVTF